ncbi:hypothetical protein BT96DRAFT_788751, partial [Gymnopus androsaceus JB14]
GDRVFTTALIWITRPDDTEEGLAYGTDKGHLCIWKRDKAESKFHEVFCRRLQADPGWEEILALAYDTNCHQFLIDVSMRPHKIKSVKIEDHYPQAITFGHNSVKGTEIWSFGCNDGDISLQFLDSQMLNGSSGDAAINLKDDIFILDNAAQGIGLYKLSSCEHMKT